MHYCLAKYEEISLDKAYRVYITDALKNIEENTGRAVKEGKAHQKRYIDLINPPPKETRTAEEIIAHIKNKLKEG